MDKTPISRLQEICAHNGLTAEYQLLSVEGVVHAPTFVYRVQVADYSQTATGQSKKKARHAVAKAMIDLLIKDSELVIENAETILECLNQPEVVDTEIVDIEEKCEEEDDTDGNPVGKLQEICMKKHWRPPHYETISEDGLPHERVFKLKCIIENMEFDEIGEGKSKRLAKRKAANLMIKRLKNANLTDSDDVMDKLQDKKSNFDTALIDNWIQTNSSGTVIPAKDKINNFYKQIDTETCDLIDSVTGKLGLEDNFESDKNSDGDYFTALTELANGLNASVKCLTVPSLSYTFKYQCLIHIIPNDISYSELPIATSWGSAEFVENAKQDAARRAIKILSILKVKEKASNTVNGINKIENNNIKVK